MENNNIEKLTIFNDVIKNIGLRLSNSIENEKLNAIFKEFGGMKNAKKMLKEKSKSRRKF